MVKSNSVMIIVSSETPPPPTYTCYIPRCKTFVLNGKQVSVCEPVAIGSTVPCPENNTGGYSTSQEACANITCGGTASPELPPRVGFGGYSGGVLSE